MSDPGRTARSMLRQVLARAASGAGAEQHFVRGIGRGGVVGIARDIDRGIPRYIARTALVASTLGAVAGGLAGCAVGPDYVRPRVDPPPAFKEAQDWAPAQPADAQPRGAWWQAFGVDELDGLEREAAAANLTVAAAEAHYRQATGLVDQARSALFPTVSASAGVTRAASPASPTVVGTKNGVPIIQSVRPPATTQDQLALSASWVPDLWGAVRRNLEEQKANEESSAATLANAVLSLQSTLATDYFALRVADEQQRLLEEAVKAYDKSLELTQSRYRGGVAARTDVVQAEALLDATRAQSIDVGIQRAQLEHAIAVLLGKAPAEFALPRRPFDLNVPAVPAQVPATLLQRRPDVAAAERLAAAANAQIGVAQAAYFPSLTLSASGGYRGLSGSDILTAPFRYWSIGPSLAETLFDAGARGAVKAQAIAAYDAAAANYRQAVLTAMQNVEDQLVALRVLNGETTIEDAAVAAAEESLRLTLNQYKAGTVSYLNVVTAQTTALNDKQTALSIRGRLLAATVQLIAALGGDWDGSLTVAASGAPAKRP